MSEPIEKIIAEQMGTTKSREEILQKQLDDIKLTDNIIEKGKKLFADKKVELIVYGMLTLIFTAFILAVINIVFSGHGKSQ